MISWKLGPAASKQQKSRQLHWPQSWQLPRTRMTTARSNARHSRRMWQVAIKSKQLAGTLAGTCKLATFFSDRWPTKLMEGSLQIGVNAGVGGRSMLCLQADSLQCI